MQSARMTAEEIEICKTIRADLDTFEALLRQTPPIHAGLTQQGYHTDMLRYHAITDLENAAVSLRKARVSKQLVIQSHEHPEEDRRWSEADRGSRAGGQRITPAYDEWPRRYR